MSNSLKKHIGMVVHAYYLRDARVIRYAEALAKEGHSVHVICLQAPDEAPVETVNGVEIHRVRFERRRGGKLWYMMEYIWAFVLFTIKLTQLENKRHYNIVHVHNMPDFLVFTGVYPKLRGALLVLDLHDPMPELFISKYNLKDGLLIRVLELQEKISCMYADKLITVDQSFKDIFVRRGLPANKISIVHNMPDDRFTDYAGDRTPDPEHFILIFAGTIAERYQLHDVIKAVDIARKDVPNIFLRLVGKLDKEGDYTDQLQALVQERGLQKHVEFHPPVLLDQVPALMARASMGVEPSRHDPYTDLVLPLKLLECVALGVPCLVSRRPTIAGYFSDEDVVYFEAGDVEGMAARIVEMAKAPERLREIAQNAKRVFQKYSWLKERETYFTVLSL